MINSNDLKNKKFLGPIFVCIGAFFWATDFPVRSNLVSIFGNTANDAIQLAMFEHVVAIILFILILIGYSVFNPNKKEEIDFKKFLTLSKLELFSLLWIGICGSALGIIFFNLAFGQAAVLQSMGIYSGYDQTLFVQKIQPVIAIGLAALLLKERLPKGFYLLSGIALIGIFFVTFGTNSYPYYTINLNHASQLIVFYAFIAAFFWGTSTVFGKILVMKVGHTLTTFGRYAVGGTFLIILNILIGTNFISALTKVSAAFWFLLYAAAISGGLVGLYIYYFGLKWTKASIATICELTYPISAVVLNFFFLNQSMYVFQWVGAIVIVVSITIMAYLNSLAPDTQIENDYRKRTKESESFTF